MDILDVLFKYDSIEFLNIILIAFDYLDKNCPELRHWKQILVDEMILFIIENDRQHCFEDEHRSSLFIFLGRCSSADVNSIKIRNSLFDNMID